jgi:putative ABC transport system permease protein
MMPRLRFFLRTALSNLRRGGQRAFVALLCVTFGVMSLVAMTQISSTLEAMQVDIPHDMIGADISMDRLAEDAILPEHVRVLDDLRQAGLLDEYTLLGYTSSLVFHLPDSGELHFPGAGLGVDPSAYPPIGTLTVESPGNVGLPTLLAERGDVLLSRDLALQYHLGVGDHIVISDLSIGAALDATIRGIIIDTPNHVGSKLYYNLQTAEALANSPYYLNTALVTSADETALQPHLQQAGWRVFVATDLADSGRQVQELFASFLNGAGVLGLLVGGVGIANTMQVLMRRRRREIAIWKSMGYQSGDLLILFALEAGLLGLAGSLLGAALGIALSAGLVDLFSRTSTVLVRWETDYATLATSAAVGTLTTVIFALWAIVRSSRVSPLTLLRNEPESSAGMPRLATLGLLLALSLPFLAVVSLVMGSLLQGVAVLLVAVFGLVGLGSFLGSALWLVVRLLPLHRAPLLQMARGSLRRRGLTPVFALIALFVGVVTLTASAVVTQNAGRVNDSATLDIQGPNLTVLAPTQQEAGVLRALQGLPVESLSTGYETRVRSIRVVGDPEETFSAVLVARAEPEGYTLRGAEWGSRPDGVYITALGGGLPEGSRLEVTLWDGSTRQFAVVGTYQTDMSALYRPELGILLPNALSQSITPPDRVRFNLRVPPARLASAAAELGAALPNATIINQQAYAARFTTGYHDLFVLAITMSGLALLAGMLLMANSVSLSVLDRRYEIGVLKAMGYARGHILVTLVVEYAIIAVVACAAGLAIVGVFLLLLGLQNPMAAKLLVMTPLAAGTVTLVTLGLTLLTVLAVTWKPTRVSPLVVLNDRE